MKKTITLLLVTSVIHSLSVTAQTPNWQWAKSAGGFLDERGRGCSTDAGGNVFVTGYFVSSPITFGTTVLINAGGGNPDMFIVKYNSGGNVLWAKSAGGTSSERGWGCSTDAGGNVFVTGHFYSSTITFGTTVLTNTGNDDMFIVKYDSGGNVLWAKSAGGTSLDLGEGCSTDAGGNVFVTGLFTSPTLSFGTTVLTNAGSTGITPDMFIVKYDGGGNVLWAKNAAGVSCGQGCSTDAGGNVFVTGYFRGSTLTLGATVLTNVNAGTEDMFIVKYDGGGNVLWAKSAGGTSDERGQGCSTDAGGNIFVTGYFGSIYPSFGTTVLTNADNTGFTPDMFIVKYNGGGNVLWAFRVGGSSGDGGQGCSTDAGGNVFVTGYFSSSTLSFGTTVLTKAGVNDMFILKYDGGGNELWAKSAGGTSDEEGKGCSTDAGGNIFVTGYFTSSTLSFGTTVLTNGNAGAGGYDMFIVKLGGTTTVGINELTDEESFSVFPNPTSGRFTIQTSNVQYPISNIEIYNTLGEKVYSTTAASRQLLNEVDISSQPNGVYFLDIKSTDESGQAEKESYIKKLIIQK